MANDRRGAGATHDDGWEYVGVDYCPEHAGIRNEDEERCDFAGVDSEPCDLHPLAYRVTLTGGAK